MDTSKEYIKKQYREHDFLFNEYKVKKKSIKQIRREYGWGINTIKRWLRLHEIPIRSCDDPIVRKQKGGFRLKKQRRNNGYQYIYFPEHPNAGSSGFISEHRLRASKMLGRELTKQDIIHHIDGDRLNNEELNLYPSNKAGHRKAHSSLMQIGYDLCKQGSLGFLNGEYQWT